MEALRVLIVDDEEEFVHALVERLNLRGMDVTGVTTGEEALKLVDAKEFDVVLMDVKMPGLGGFRAIEEIKESRPNLQVIMLTGHASAQDEWRGLQLGCHDYLVKPVKLEDLVNVLNDAAGRSREEK